MIEPIYATEEEERDVGILLADASALRIRRARQAVLVNLQIMADEIGCEFDESKVVFPPRGLLIKALTEQQKRAFNEILGIQYATLNSEQQQELLQIPIHERGDPMVSLKAAVKVAGVQANFSDKPFDAVCGSYAGQKRIMHIRQEVAISALKVFRGLNAINLVAHVEDAWRPEDVQKNLLIRRVIDNARSYPNWMWKDVQTVAYSLTAPCPGLAGHQAGAALDITLMEARGNEYTALDRGNHYPEGGVVSSLHFPYITLEHWISRMYFTQAMWMGDLKVLPTENWHASRFDRGLGNDGTVKMKVARNAPLKGYIPKTNINEGKLDTYDACEYDKMYLSDADVEWLVAASRAKNPDGDKYRFERLNLVTLLRQHQQNPLEFPETRQSV